eukprot:SAG31_NODE_2273_length_6037_cov_11.461862_6_plen_193_part_00
MQSYWYWGNAQLYALCHHTAESAGGSRVRLFPARKYRNDSASTWAIVSASFAGGVDSADEEFVADDRGGSCSDDDVIGHAALHQQWMSKRDQMLEQAAVASATGRASCRLPREAAVNQGDLRSLWSQQRQWQTNNSDDYDSSEEIDRAIDATQAELEVVPGGGLLQHQNGGAFVVKDDTVEPVRKFAPREIP